MKLLEKLIKSFKNSQEKTQKQEIKSKDKNITSTDSLVSHFELVEGITPEQIEAKEFHKQFTEFINGGHNLYLSNLKFISPLNKQGQPAKDDSKKNESVVSFTHMENEAICGKYDNKYYRYFETDQSMQVYYFEEKDDTLQTTSISVNQNGDCIEHVCSGENNQIVETYQRMANAVDLRINLINNSEFKFDVSQEQ